MVELRERPAAQPKGEAAPAAPAPRPVEGQRGFPLELMRRFGEEVDRMFEEGPLGLGRSRWPSWLGRGHELFKRELGLVPGEWSPRVEIREQEGRLLVRAELPGLTPEDVKVEVTPEYLTLEGEKKEERHEREQGYRYCERAFGRFYRAIPLPEGVDATHATATFEHGVLEVALPAPKLAAKRPRRVEIHPAK